MCVIGNPPYSGESANKGDWIMGLLDDYKKEPGGKEKLKERNPKWINDDYVKFLRYGQYFIEKNGTGILAFINPHGFLDNPTFRGMRWNLLNTYDKIYTIDLHGNAKKKEVAPDGSADINVFDIEQGVSINIFVKTGKKKLNELGKVLHYDLFGKRQEKYDFLTKNSIKSIAFNEISNISPDYFFIYKNYDEQNNYEKGFKVSDLFIVKTAAIVTSNDSILISHDRDILLRNVSEHYSIKADPALVKSISYRPFDNKFVYYDVKIIERAREKVMKHMANTCNIGFATVNRQPLSNPTTYYFLTESIISNGFIRSDSVSIDNLMPLYLYPETKGQQTIEQTAGRAPNLDTNIVNNFSANLVLRFVKEKEISRDTFAPIDILDYIYAVLHSPVYRLKYKEFLKIDFPRVPYPKDKDTFWQLVKLGGEIREIHLLKNDAVGKLLTEYPLGGSNIVGKTSYQRDRVYINEVQYFDNVPETAWNCYIGGYKPAQKWLKDRKGLKLEFDDILHYQKIIKALSETGRLMNEVDLVDFHS